MLASGVEPKKRGKAPKENKIETVKTARPKKSAIKKVAPVQVAVKKLTAKDLKAKI
jgi:hypothetical protein